MKKKDDPTFDSVDEELARAGDEMFEAIRVRELSMWQAEHDKLEREQKKRLEAFDLSMIWSASTPLSSPLLQAILKLPETYQQALAITFGILSREEAFGSNTDQGKISYICKKALHRLRAVINDEFADEIGDIRDYYAIRKTTVLDTQCHPMLDSKNHPMWRHFDVDARNRNRKRLRRRQCLLP